VSGAAILALGAAFCFALALILTQYGLRTVPSWRSPLCTIGGSMVLAWSAALIFVDWRSVDGRAAAIFVGVNPWSRFWRPWVCSEFSSAWPA
jgi:drug/metabolite transporter (DMT)-like permease